MNTNQKGFVFMNSLVPLLSAKRDSRNECGALAQRWLMTTPEYAVRCHVSSRTVQNWVERKVIPILKFGRLVRIDPQRADQALRKFEVREAGYRRGAPE